jgi:mannose-6-phosphate isomerase
MRGERDMGSENQINGAPPWGTWCVLEDEADFKVKRVNILQGKRLSYQKHFKRDEHWQIVRGAARVTLNGEESLLNPGDYIVIERQKLHRIENIGTEVLVFIEIQRGEYFGEDDIVRMEDDYGRV